MKGGSTMEYKKLIGWVLAGVLAGTSLGGTAVVHGAAGGVKAASGTQRNANDTSRARKVRTTAEDASTATDRKAGDEAESMKGTKGTKEAAAPSRAAAAEKPPKSGAASSKALQEAEKAAMGKGAGTSEKIEAEESTAKQPGGSTGAKPSTRRSGKTDAETAQKGKKPDTDAASGNTGSSDTAVIRIKKDGTLVVDRPAGQAEETPVSGRLTIRAGKGGTSVSEHVVRKGGSASKASDAGEEGANLDAAADSEAAKSSAASEKEEASSPTAVMQAERPVAGDEGFTPSGLTVQGAEQAEPTAGNMAVSARTAARVGELMQKFKLLGDAQGGAYSWVYTSPNWTGEEASRPTVGISYFLLSGSGALRFQKLDCDELWYFHEGCGLKLTVLLPDGKLREFRLGVGAEDMPMVLIPKGQIFAAENIDPMGYSFISCMTTPALQADGIRIMGREELLKKYPQAKEAIGKYSDASLDAAAPAEKEVPQAGNEAAARTGGGGNG